MQAREIIENLGLMPHPEGGWYREVYRSTRQVGREHAARSALTTIYYLLERGQVSRWHVVDADEAWHFYAGAPLELFAYHPGSRELVRQVLSAPGSGGQPVAVVAADLWQAARCLGDYSLLGCTVGPGFEYSGFRLVASLPECAAHFADVIGEWRQLL